MSSVDSSLLSGASYLTHNVYTAMFSDKMTVEAFRIFTVILGSLATILSLSATTIYGLWVLAGDLGYVIVFPQFLMAVHWPEQVNGFGSLSSALVGSILRLLIGEPLVGLPALIETTDNAGQLTFPAKTSIMLATLTTLIVSSKLVNAFRRFEMHF